jgi:hypothetical protein
VNGNGVVNAQQPFLLQGNGGNTIVVVRDGTRADYYDLISGVWTERFFGQDKLTYNSGSAEFALTDTLGNVTKFHDFSGGIPAPQRGGLKSFTDAAGNAISVAYTGGGSVDEVTRVATVGMTTVTESLVYTYLSSPDPNHGLVATVTLRRKVGAGAYSMVRSVEYAYYDGVEAHGNLGDLKTAVVKDAAGAEIDTKYYRYYTAGEAGGYTHGLKFLLEGGAFDRMTEDHGSDLEVIPDNQLAPTPTCTSSTTRLTGSRGKSSRGPATRPARASTRSATRQVPTPPGQTRGRPRRWRRCRTGTRTPFTPTPTAR